MKLPVSGHDVWDALKSVFGFSEDQTNAQSLGTAKRYTYDDLPAPGDGEINPETGYVSIKRIPKHEFQTWKKVIFITVIVVFVGFSLFMGFGKFSTIKTEYREDEERPGFYELYSFRGSDRNKVLYVDFARKMVADKRENIFADLTYHDEIQEDQVVTRVAQFACTESHGVEEVHIGASVVEIERWAFAYMKKVQNFFVDPANPKYRDIDGVLYSKDGKTLIQYPIGREDKVYVIPAGTEILGEASFYEDSEDRSKSMLEEVVFPESLLEIHEMAFFGNRHLNKLELPTNLKVIDKDAFSKCRYLPQNIFIPKSVAYIGKYAFYEACDQEGVAGPYYGVEHMYFERPLSSTVFDLHDKEGDAERESGAVRATGKLVVREYWLPKIHKAMFKTQYAAPYKPAERESHFGISRAAFDAIVKEAANG